MAEDLKDVFGNIIKMPSTEGVSAPDLRESLDRLLLLIAKYMTSGDPQEWVNYCWISDLSSISDFFLEDYQIAEIASTLNLTIQPGDLLVDIARRMSNN